MPNKRSKLKKTNQTIIWNRDALYFRAIASYLYQTYICLKKKLLFVRKYTFDVSIVLFILTIGTYVFFPAMVNADTEDSSIQDSKSLIMNKPYQLNFAMKFDDKP